MVSCWRSASGRAVWGLPGGGGSTPPHTHHPWGFNFLASPGLQHAVRPQPVDGHRLVARLRPVQQHEGQQRLQPLWCRLGRAVKWGRWGECGPVPGMCGTGLAGQAPRMVDAFVQGQREETRVNKRGVRYSQMV